MTNLNNEVIHKIAERNPTAESFFTYAACRTRNAREGITRLPALRAQMSKEGFHPVPQDLLSMFRELERAGIGRLQGDKFKWDVSMKDLGGAITPTPASTPQPTPLQLPKALKSLTVFFENNKEASISFTPNLTKDEVKFIAEKLLQECR